MSDHVFKASDLVPSAALSGVGDGFPPVAGDLAAGEMQDSAARQMSAILQINLSKEAVTCDGISLPSGDQAVFHMARALIDAGHARKALCEVRRNGNLIFAPGHLGWWADRSVTEGDKSARFVKYKPFPAGVFTSEAAQ